MKMFKSTSMSKYLPQRGFYWFKLILKPVLVLGCLVLVILGIGLGQRMGWVPRTDPEAEVAEAEDDGIEYVCPMLCVPPSPQPGRCPVCHMELQPREVSAEDRDDLIGVRIDAVARRLANIQTVAAVREPLVKRVRAQGRIDYAESGLATIPAYVPGRVEKMFIDYTGARVERGDDLALLYSPELYSAQVELLQAAEALRREQEGRFAEANQRLYESARRRLIEFGLPESHIEQLEASGRAETRNRIVAPIGGTVIEREVVEGDYVTAGQPLFRIADLSTVWLQLELFPEDAGLLRYAQLVTIRIYSQPGRTFTGRIDFIDPAIESASQTVRVRVVVPNEFGLIRIGELAEGEIHAEVTATGELAEVVFDPDLGGKWVCTRHPAVVHDEAGVCPDDGTRLVSAEEFGYTATPPGDYGTIVVPRNAVLQSSEASVVYVETEPGRFEFRQVEIGPVVGGKIAIVSGVEAGERVVSQAAFLLDTTFNLARNKPSLIDPTAHHPVLEQLAQAEAERSAETEAALAELPSEDRKLAEQQEICPVTEMPLGSMGVPIKVDVEGRDVFICCEGCRTPLLDQPEHYFEVLERHQKSDQPPPADDRAARQAREIEAALTQLSPEDRRQAEQQEMCPIANMPLGSMGVPIKVEKGDQSLFICCEGCRTSLLNNWDEHYQRFMGDPD